MSPDSHDPRINKILQLVCQLISCDPTESRRPESDPGDDTDSILEHLITFVERYRQLGVSENYFSNVLQSIMDSLMISDLAGKITWVNRSACQLLGYREEELLSRSINDFFVEPFDIDDSAGAASQERNIIAKDGRFISVQCSRSRLRNHQDQREGFIWAVQDIAERKRIEAALRDSEERFRAAFVNANVGVALVDLPGHYLKVNHVMCQIFGYNQDELERMSYQDLTYQNDQDFSEETRQRVILSEPGQVRFIKRYVHKDGHLIWAEVASSLIRDVEDAPQYFITHVRDVTSQKLAEEALRVSEANAREFQVKLKELQKISLELAVVESPEELCRRAIELGHSVLGFDRISLLLFDHVEKSKVIRFGIESTGELRIAHEENYRIEDDPMHSLLTHREDIYVNEDATLSDSEGVTGRGWNVMVGLWDAHTSIGWLAADNSFEKKPLMPYQTELLALYGLTLGHLVTQKRTEAALRKSEFFLQKSQVVGRIGSYYFDARTGKWISSPMLDTLFGIDEGFPKDVEGWISLVHPEHKEEMFNHFSQHVLAEHHRFDKEYRIVRQDNQQEYWVHGLGELEFDDQGNVIAMIGTIQDITERKQAERILQTSEERLVKAQALAHVGNWEIDLRARTIWGSAEALRIYGVDLSHPFLPLDVIQNCVLPQYRPALDENLRGLIAGTQSYDVFFQIHRLDNGEVRYVHSIGECARDEGGSPVKILGVVQDVTESQAIQAQLETTLSFQEAAFEASADGILDVDMTGKIITFNRKFAEMWRIPDSILASRDDDLTLQTAITQVKNPEAFLQKIHDLYIQPDKVSFDLLEMVDGRVIERYSQPQYVGSQIVGRVWNFRDITERKQAEETLQRSERKYRMLFENMTAGFAVHETIYDIYGQPVDYRYLEVNPAFEKLTGQPASVLLGKTVKEAQTDSEPHKIQVLGRVAQTGEPASYEDYLKETDRYYDTWVFKPSRDQVAVTFIDITERKRAEAAIRKLNQELEQRVKERTAELEAANEEIKNFAYIVSHDLRAPLVNLKGFAAELRAALKEVEAGCATLLPQVDDYKRIAVTRAFQEDIPEALQYIESSVGHMDGFIRAILKLSRLGHQQFELVEIDIRAIVDKILGTLAFQLTDQNVRVTVGNLPTVTGDRISLEQIFGNILTNAVIYLLPGCPGEIEISGERMAHETFFRIRDNGRGIAQEDMGNVFVPFRRAGRQDVPGEGMGLAYVQTLVRRHGGRIWCESKLGIGTTFMFTISHHLKADTDQDDR